MDALRIRTPTHLHKAFTRTYMYVRMLRSVQLGCGQLIILGYCIVDKPVVSIVQFLGWFVDTTISYQTRQLVLACVNILVFVFIEKK